MNDTLNDTLQEAIIRHLHAVADSVAAARDIEDLLVATLGQLAEGGRVASQLARECGEVVPRPQATQLLQQAARDGRSPSRYYALAEELGVWAVIAIAIWTDAHGRA